MSEKINTSQKPAPLLKNDPTKDTRKKEEEEKNFRYFTLLMLFSLIAGLFGQPTTGNIRGSVIDAGTKVPLIGANIVVVDNTFGASTDLDGNFLINRVPTGTYNIKVSYQGYETITKSDIVVKSDRDQYVNFELNELVGETDVVVVTAGYFANSNEEPSSSVALSHAELRRGPGSAGDIARAVTSLPSVTTISDEKNSLIIRGGSPVENGFYIDNIEINNINHFGSQGSTDGAVSILNIDLVDDVTFHAGGFSSKYGERLSSVMDINLREGNKENFNAQLDLSMIGAGAVIEGPFAGKQGSYLIAGKRSYLDLVAGSVDIGQGSMPEYFDIQSKVTYSINPKHKLSLINILAKDDQKVKRNDCIEDELPSYGDLDLTLATNGVNWRAIWGTIGFSNTSLSHSFHNHEITSYRTKDYIDTGIDNLLVDMQSNEQEIRFRNENHIKLDASYELEFGIESKIIMYDYDIYYASFIDNLGNETPEISIDKNESTWKTGGFLSLTWKPTALLTLNPSVRADYFDYTENYSLSPRVSLSYKFTDKLTFNTSAGMYYQDIPLAMITQQETNRYLDKLKLEQYIAGISYLLLEDTKLSLEVYDKEYSCFPVSPENPGDFPIDGGIDMMMFIPREDMESSGMAYSRGVELLIQKKMKKGLYGLGSVSYSVSKYKDFEGTWRNRSNDYRLSVNVEAGYKPNSKWDISFQWSYAGGRPYTPIDEEASEEINQLVTDSEKINEKRLPDFHSLKLRLDRRFDFRKTNMIVYLSVWNVYNRENIYAYQWNEIENEKLAMKQWSVMPIIGLEFEF